MFEAILERAAIMELGGELPREQSEQVAIAEIIPGSPPIASRVVFAAIELASLVEPARCESVLEQLNASLHPLFRDAYEECNQ